MPDTSWILPKLLSGLGVPKPGEGDVSNLTHRRANRLGDEEPPEVGQGLFSSREHISCLLFHRLPHVRIYRVAVHIGEQVGSPLCKLLTAMGDLCMEG